MLHSKEFLSQVLLLREGSLQLRKAVSCKEKNTRGRVNESIFYKSITTYVPVYLCWYLFIPILTTLQIACKPMGNLQVTIALMLLKKTINK